MEERFLALEANVRELKTLAQHDRAAFSSSISNIEQRLGGQPRLAIDRPATIPSSSVPGVPQPRSDVPVLSNRAIPQDVLVSASDSAPYIADPLYPSIDVQLPGDSWFRSIRGWFRSSPPSST